MALRDQHGAPVDLASVPASGRSALVVFFPAAWTPVCAGELEAVQADLPSFQNARVQVLAVSTDPVPSLAAWARHQGFGFPVLSDAWPHGAAARAWGIFDERSGTARRGTFLVDPTGMVRFAQLGPVGVPRDTAAWRAAVRAVTFGSDPG
ncbi:redoxin domain-containing protein [Nakamurella sp. YIM 132084]|uniref:Redoxin domain-containing protein n=2 Tax=Nakamurella leprariae TaxID=2803911 RepID=A0A938YDH6_9ACTN|nr:redoxin domain-containing protein [Nakamurella leprariae]